MPLGSRMPSCGPRHFPAIVPARAGALPKRPAPGATPVGRAESRERKGNPAGSRPWKTDRLLDKSLLSAPFQNVPFIAVTSFLCLRFFSPAIMSPKLFHLRERHADARTSRTLLLLAKVWTCGLGWEGQLNCKGILAYSVVSHQLALGMPCSQATGTPWHCTSQFTKHSCDHLLRAPSIHKETNPRARRVNWDLRTQVLSPGLHVSAV